MYKWNNKILNKFADPKNTKKKTLAFQQKKRSTDSIRARARQVIATEFQTQIINSLMVSIKRCGRNALLMANKRQEIKAKERKMLSF